LDGKKGKLMAKTMRATTGERCPACGKMNSKIIDTRMENGYRKRKRECLSCGSRWSTIEVRMKEEKA